MTEIAKLRTLLERATKGPWSAHEEPGMTYPDGDVDKGGYRINAPDVEQLAYLWREMNLFGSPEEFGAVEAEANAHLIVTLRNTVEKLLAVCEAAEATLGLYQTPEGVYLTGLRPEIYALRDALTAIQSTGETGTRER